jgi:hypothetical protein
MKPDRNKVDLEFINWIKQIAEIAKKNGDTFDAFYIEGMVTHFYVWPENPTQAYQSYKELRSRYEALNHKML